MNLYGLWVAVGGFCGAIARYAVSVWVVRKFPSSFPYGTLFVNISGSLLLGMVIGAGMTRWAEILFGVGFLGAYTTFSTFKLENIRLVADRKWGTALIYMAISYSAGLTMAWAGYGLGSLMTK